MSLHPRYSLLTLLVLTALVAGGVKLWHGPHHVVERRSPSKEFEYTYTRDLYGNKVVDGPCIIRAFDSDERLLLSSILFVRQGQIVNWQYLLAVTPNNPDFPPVIVDDENIAGSPLNDEEQNILIEAIQAARNQKHHPEPGWIWRETLTTARYLYRESIQTFEQYENYHEDFLNKPSYLTDY